MLPDLIVVPPAGSGPQGCSRGVSGSANASTAGSDLRAGAVRTLGIDFGERLWALV